MSARNSTLAPSLIGKDLEMARSTFLKIGPQKRVDGALPKPYVDNAGNVNAGFVLKGPPALSGYHNRGSVVAGYPAAVGVVPSGRNSSPTLSHRSGTAFGTPACPLG